ncbi:MAG: hypothetical protein KDD47_24860, partial [Acidobacteria bacterium]|nr:hypothetical protein [Acidobacteriota bacterium]
MLSVPHRWLSFGGFAVFALVLFGGFAGPAHAATSCFNVSCAMSCTPGAPVQISTLVPSSEFPAGAGTPIAFVDPADGRNRRLIATQQG